VQAFRVNSSSFRLRLYQRDFTRRRVRQDCKRSGRGTGFPKRLQVAAVDQQRRAMTSWALRNVQRASQHAWTAEVKVANRILFARLQEAWERIMKKVNNVQLLVK